MRNLWDRHNTANLSASFERLWGDDADYPAHFMPCSKVRGIIAIGGMKPLDRSSLQLFFELFTESLPFTRPGGVRIIFEIGEPSKELGDRVVLRLGAAFSFLILNRVGMKKRSRGLALTGQTQKGADYRHPTNMPLSRGEADSQFQRIMKSTNGHSEREHQSGIKEAESFVWKRETSKRRRSLTGPPLL